MNTRIVIPIRSCLVTVAALAAAAVSTPAGAAGFGGALQPGSTVCTDWLRTDGGGVYLQGYAAGTGTYTWTMWMSSFPGGPETAIFRTVGTSVTRHVVPPVTGTFFYRNCLDVANRRTTGYRLHVTAGIRSVNPVYGIGPHTANLTPGSQACGEFAMGPARLRGNSNQIVQWSLRGTDMDYASLGPLFLLTGETANQVFDPGPSVFSMDACATNSASVPTSIAFDLSNP
jgi:hypothetical protein